MYGVFETWLPEYEPNINENKDKAEFDYKDLNDHMWILIKSSKVSIGNNSSYLLNPFFLSSFKKQNRSKKSKSLKENYYNQYNSYKHLMLLFSLY